MMNVMEHKKHKMSILFTKKIMEHNKKNHTMYILFTFFSNTG